MEIFRKKTMYYLADFKRRYEKELDKLPSNYVLDKNKGIGRGLQESFLMEGEDKRGNVQQVRDRIKGFRDGIKKGQSDPLLVRQALGGSKQNKSYSTPQKRLQNKRDSLLETRKRQLKEYKISPYQSLVQKPEYSQSKAKKVKAKKGGQIFQERNKIIRTADSKLANLVNETTRRDVQSTIDIARARGKPRNIETKVDKIIPQPPSTPPTSSIPSPPKVVSTNAPPTVTTQKVAKKASTGLGKKLAIGLGGTAAVLGGAYALNKLRKSRSDKGKTRGRYKR